MERLGKFMVRILFLSSMTAVSQDPVSLEGRVQSRDGDVAGTHVLNVTADRASITGINGVFAIPVRLNDTLVFSAVQFKRKELVVTLPVLERKFLFVFLEDALTELDEVIVRPYNLSGKFGLDIRMDTTITASTLRLPNANVRALSQSERLLYTATKLYDIREPNKINMDPVINFFSGRTKMLRNRVARDRKYDLAQRLRRSYPDSFYVEELRVPFPMIEDFIYFCEVDPAFLSFVYSRNDLKLLDFLIFKSKAYRKNNELD